MYDWGVSESARSTIMRKHHNDNGVDAGTDTIRLFGVVPESFVDGPGVRYAIFTQGCPHACHGCHNKGSWNISSGTVRKIGDIVDDIEGSHLASGVSITGGDPFYQPDACLSLVKSIRRRLPSYTIWIWSGWTYEELYKDETCREILNECDVLIDGPFVAEKKTLSLPWRGSSNQRVINLRASEPGSIVLIDDNASF